MKRERFFGFQALVFCLVGAAFTTIYIPQPVLPVLQTEFGVNESTASFTISAVVLGIALSNLPFGMLADRYSIKPIILTGGLVITACGLFSAITTNLTLMIIARFIQGLFIPALTTCLAAYLSRMLPIERLNVVMGSYVSATVAGGLGGRLLGGWIHPPLHWRYAFVTASLFLLAATIAALVWIPEDRRVFEASSRPVGFTQLIKKEELFRLYCVAFASFFIFSSIYNYLPFYLAAPPFNAPTEIITLLYLSYVFGIVSGPLSGRISNRFDSGTTMIFGTLAFALFILATLLKSVPVIAISLAGICAGYFTVHSTAIALLNKKLSSSKGRANSLYVLFYYLGGSVGITISGYLYLFAGWNGVVLLGTALLLVPLGTGIAERIREKRALGK